MQSALDMALAQARKAEASRVYVIKLRVGDLSGVVPEALQFAFESLAAGTMADGAALEIEPVAARFWCGECRKEFQAAQVFAECPDCRQVSGDLRAGREIELASMEIE